MNNWLTIFGKFQVLQNASRDSVWKSWKKTFTKSLETFAHSS